MKIRSYKNILIFLSVLIATILLYFWFVNSTYFDPVNDWIRENVLLALLILTGIKIIGIIWPPIPGGVLTLGSIEFLGWELAYGADIVGSLIGCTLAYWIGQRYGYPFLYKIFDQSSIDKIQSVKIKKQRELESMIVLNMTGGTIIEVIAYGAGLLKITYWKFFVARVVSHLITGLPLYFFIDRIANGQNALLNFALLAIMFIFLWRFKNRYIE